MAAMLLEIANELQGEAKLNEPFASCTAAGISRIEPDSYLIIPLMNWPTLRPAIECHERQCELLHSIRSRSHDPLQRLRAIPSMPGSIAPSCA